MTNSKLLSALLCFAWLTLLSGAALFSTSRVAEAQLACPNSSVRSTLVGRYAYNNIERNLGGAPSCDRNIRIPTDGIRVFSPWRDCRSGTFSFVRESGGGAVPTSLSCPNCTRTGVRGATLAPGTSSSVTAFFRFPDGAMARYTATITRSVADPGDGSFVCSISNAVVAGGAFGGDIVPPTVTLGALTPVGDGTYRSAITLSEPAGNGTAFELADLTLTNATATLNGAGTAFTAILTPRADGVLRLAVAAGAFQDAGGNANTAGPEVALAHDGSRPSVAISGQPAQVMAGQSFPVSIQFSESVTGFELGDIALVNARAVSVTGANATYSAVIAATGGGAVQIEIPAGVAQDGAGNLNQASSVVTLSDRTIEETQSQIAGLLATRANNLAGNQPGLSCFLSGGCQGRVEAQATQGQLSFDIQAKRDMPVWLSITGAHSTVGQSRDDYYLATFGTHRWLSETALIGAMVQLDYQASTSGAQSLKGHGWLVGPYVVAQMQDPALYLEARALWGKSVNEISPFGTYKDQFETDRALVQAKLSAELEARSVSLRPFLSGTYVADHQHSYQDSLGNTIPGQHTALRQISAGVDLSTPISFGDQDWTLNGSFSVIHSDTVRNGAAVNNAVQAGAAAFDGTRSRINLGVSRSQPGGQIMVSGFYDGIGAKGYESLGLNLSWSFRF